MKNSQLQRPELPLTMKDALAAGWTATGNDATISPNERQEHGTKTMRHPSFPGLNLEVRYKATRTFGSTKFTGKLVTHEQHQANLERFRRNLGLSATA